MIWLHNLYQHAISIHVSSALYSLYWNTKLSSLASLTKTLGLYLLSLDRKQIYFFYGFTPKKLKWSWFIVLTTTAFSRSVDHRVCDNLQKKKWKIWCFFEITCHIPVLLSSGTGQAGLPGLKACVNDKYLQADSETRWENEHEVSGHHYRKEQDKLDLNSRISVVESNFRYRSHANFSNWFVLKRISVDIRLFVLQCGFCRMLM